jgi:hypothetical protein
MAVRHELARDFCRSKDAPAAAKPAILAQAGTFDSGRERLLPHARASSDGPGSVTWREPRS